MPPIPAPMPLTIPDINVLDQAEVRNNHQLLTSIVQESHPEVDVKQGALYNLLFYLSAILTTSNQLMAKRVRQSVSLAAINANAALATDAIVDNLLSNFGLTRLPGVQASGPVQILLSSPVVVTIPKGAVFTAGSQTFVADASYTSRLSQTAVLASTDRLVTTLSPSSYAFTINVIAQNVGSAGNVQRGTRMVPTIPPSPYFTQALVLTDFSNGADRETNAQLMTRLSSGAGLKAWSNRMTIDAMIRNQPAFGRILGTSLIGFGDIEMVRDQHSLWPGSMGGRADLYVRSQERVATTVLNKTATYIGLSGGNGLWQFSFGRDEVPGFYEIDKITKPGLIDIASTFAIQTETRGYDLTNVPAVVPDITTATEAQYSRYATGTFQFIDTATATTGLIANLSTAQYDVSVRYMPLVDQIQDYIKQRTVTGPAGDVLVKAPIPVFTMISFSVELRTGMTSPSIPAIQDAVAAAVNRLAFGNKLTAAVISTAVTPLLPAGAGLSQIAMSGRVRHSDNSITNVIANDVLTIPTDPAKPMTSPRTTAYLLSPADVTVTVATVTGS